MEQQLTNHESSIQDIKKKCVAKVTYLLDKYKDDSYALERIHKYCSEIMPHAIEASVQQHSQREERKTELKETSTAFMDSFINSELTYFYFSNSNIFVTYDGFEFKIISEDDISAKVILELSSNPTLCVWKHKIKASILKRIKERDLSEIVPSSTTVQKVLSLIWPAVFATRDEAKYFLTVVGDAICKKDIENVYFVHDRAKRFIEQLSQGIMFFKGLSASAISHCFRYRYQSTPYSLCRVIKIQGHGDNLISPQIDPLEVFFVSQYYSIRYGSADNFLSRASIKSCVQHAKIVADLAGQQKAISWFASEALVLLPYEPNNIIDSENTLDARAIQFIWKRFCQKNKIPSIINLNQIVSLLRTLPAFAARYDDSRSTFLCVAGNTEYLPSVALFNEFWQATIKETHHLDEDSIEYELEQLEIDEIVTLLGSWLRKNGKIKTTHAPLEDEEVLACIKHFFPHVRVEDNKYVFGISCSLWNKQKDIKDFLDDYLLLTDNLTTTTTAYSNLYRAYCREKLRTAICLANKNYFEKVCASYVART
jgi:hypothetical protein